MYVTMPLSRRLCRGRATLLIRPKDHQDIATTTYEYTTYVSCLTVGCQVVRLRRTGYLALSTVDVRGVFDRWWLMPCREESVLPRTPYDDVHVAHGRDTAVIRD